MVTADTSTWVAFLNGNPGDDVLLLKKSLQDPPLTALDPGFGPRAAPLRSKALAKRRRARLADSLVAQLCLDANIPLITRDRDFRAFAQSSNLHLLLTP